MSCLYSTSFKGTFKAHSNIYVEPLSMYAVIGIRIMALETI